jgi:hypothetical protein
MRPRREKSACWLLLLFRLPATHQAERVAIWRKLKRSGAIQIQTSTYVLPDAPARYEYFQWLTKGIRDAGGDATLVRAREIEGLPDAKLVDLFNSARAKDYTLLVKQLQSLLTRGKKMDEVEDIRKQFRDIRERDFFDSPRAQDVEMLLHKIEKTTKAPTRVNPKNYRNKTWLTRPRPEIDRVGSAWLIRKFIDPKAQFIFNRQASARPKAISFDMLEAEFSHQGEDCTFETLTRRFAIRDKAVRKIGEMIHDADLDDARFQRVEAIGIDRVLKGWAKAGMSDHELLRNGFTMFEGLYRHLQRW